MILAFGKYRLDLDRRELRRGPDLIAVQPQVLDLLAYLIRHRDHVVSKNELSEAVWGGRIVSDSAVTTRINAVRQAIGDDGKLQYLIRTFTSRGLRFVGEVRDVPDRLLPVAVQHLTPFHGPTITVLPFADLNDDPELKHFALGVAEEITITLSRVHWICVVGDSARERSAAIAAQASRKPQARYFVAGSVRRHQNRVRLAVHLVETQTGVHLWSDHFDGGFESPLGLQDNVASKEIEPVLQLVEGARALNRSSDDLTAYHAYLRASTMLLTSARQISEAVFLLESTVSRDRNYGPALGLAANCYMRLCMDGVSHNPLEDTRKAADLARHALQLAPDDPGTLANVARPLAYTGEDIGAAIELMDRALSLNPNFARGWYIRAFLRYWAGDPDTSIDELETALRLCPRGRFGTTYTVIGNALVFSQRFEEAIPKLQFAIHQDPSFPPNYRLLAVCHAHLGQLDEARATIARLPETAPLDLPNLARSYRAMFRNPEQRESAWTGIRLAAGV